MTTDSIVTWRFVGIFFLGIVFFSYPVMTLFNVEIMLFGIPLLYFYIFIFWLVIIILINFVSRKRAIKSTDSFYITNLKE